jgi:hypothetical protein
MMSRTSRMLKWIGAGTVLLAAAPIAWPAEQPSRPNPVVVPEVHENTQVRESDHPAFHRTCASCHLTVPHSTQAR